MPGPAGHPSRLAERGRSRGRVILGLLGALLFLVFASGCSLLSGEEKLSGGGANGQLEKTKLRVGAMPIIDSAPVHIALQEGYFRQEGLDVELVTIAGASAGVPALVSDDLQYTYGAWVPYFQAQARGVADLALVADCYQIGSGMFMIMVKSGSPITKPTDLVGKKIATNTFNTITDLLAKSVLSTNQVDPAQVNFVEVPFPDMQARLQDGSIEAAIMLEPFVTKAQREIGAVPLLDTSVGPTKEFPISGFAATKKFVQENPRTTEAFRRALAKASELAARRDIVEKAVQRYAKIDADTASLVKMGTFPTSMDPSRLQRGADLMLQYGMLQQRMDVSSMILQAGEQK